MRRVGAPIRSRPLFLHVAPNANLELTIGDALRSKESTVIQWLQTLDDTACYLH
jgi:hypothetical protein